MHITYKNGELYDIQYNNTFIGRNADELIFTLSEEIKNFKTIKTNKQIIAYFITIYMTN